MATFEIDGKKIAIPLILNEPSLTKEIQRLRAIVKTKLDDESYAVVGVKEDSYGHLLVVLKKQQ